MITNADNTVLYGTTVSGGLNNSGTIYSILPDGSNYTVLYNFDFRDQSGCNPYAGLFLSSNKLYGTNFATGNYNAGTIFAYDISGASIELVYTFTGTTGGIGPKSTLIKSGSLLYGTTVQGGNYNTGTIFSYNLTVVLIHHYCHKCVIIHSSFIIFDFIKKCKGTENKKYII